MCGEASRGGGGHRVVQAVEQSHTCQIIAHATTDGQEEVDAPNPLGLGAQTWVHSGADRAGGLSREHFHIAVSERWKNGNGEEDDTQAPNPLCHRAPEEQAMRQHLYIIKDATACSSETRNGLKVGIGEVGDIPTDEERKRAKETEDEPRERHQQIGFATAKGVIGISTDVLEQDSTQYGDNHRHHEGQRVILAQIKGETRAQHHHSYFDEEQRADDFIYNLEIEHQRKNFSSRDISTS